MNKYSDLELRFHSTKNLPPLTSPKPRSLLSEEFEGIMSPSYSMFDTTRISSLTQLENEKAEILSNNCIFSPVSQRMVSEIPLSHKTSDFQALLHSIELITKKRKLTNSKTLVEGEIFSLGLEQGELHYFKVFCRDKKSPVKFNIRRSYGKLRVFVSKNWEKPTSSHCENEFILNHFEVQDRGLKFTSEYVYFTIEAVTDVEFSIGLSFGKIGNLYIPYEQHHKSKRNLEKEFEELRKNDDLRLKLKQKVDRLLKNRKMSYIKLAGSKNFLKLNKNVKSISSEKLFQTWDEKKELVIKRKSEKYLERKEQVMKLLNKKELQSQLHEMTKEENEKREKNMKLKMEWSKLIIFIISASKLRKLWFDNRAEVMILLQQSACARLIQTTFKAKYTNFTMKNTILLHARNNLLLFYQAMRPTETRECKRIFLYACRQSAINNRLSLSFCKFIKKITSIQKATKTFIFRTKSRLNELTKLWNTVMTKMTYRISSTQATRYIKITSLTRNGILKQYYSTRFFEYLRALRSLSSVLSNKSSLSKTKTKGLEFHFMPSELVMKQLIEQAADRS